MSRLAASAGLPTSNWAGNVTWKAARHHAPESVEELQRVVHEAAGMVRVVGTRHSFSDIADTRDTLISLHKMRAPLPEGDGELVAPSMHSSSDKVGHVVLRHRVPTSPTGYTATCSPATSCAALAAQLQEHGFALSSGG